MDTIKTQISTVLAKRRKKSDQSEVKKNQQEEKKTDNEFLIMYRASLDEFYCLEEEKADYLNGMIVINSPASIQHEDIFCSLIVKMRSYAQNNNLGKVLGSRALIVLGNDYRFEPDIVYISNKNKGEFKEFEFEGVPDLVIEILSKSTKKYDLNIKRPIYQEFRVKEIIFIDQETNEKVIDILNEDNIYNSYELKSDEIYELKSLPGISI
jgi:Uma2 family endonuclease